MTTDHHTPTTAAEALAALTEEQRQAIRNDGYKYGDDCDSWPDYERLEGYRDLVLINFYGCGDDRCDCTRLDIYDLGREVLALLRERDDRDPVVIEQRRRRAAEQRWASLRRGVLSKANAEVNAKAWLAIAAMDADTLDTIRGFGAVCFTPAIAPKLEPLGLVESLGDGALTGEPIWRATPAGYAAISIIRQCLEQEP